LLDPAPRKEAWAKEEEIVLDKSWGFIGQGRAGKRG